MAKMRDVQKSRRTASPDTPFNTRPVSDEQFEILIPEGAETGKIPAGKYIGKLIALVKDVSKKKEDGSGGNPMWVATFTIVEGPYIGMDFNLWLSLQPNALWKLADTLTALGVAWKPGSPIKFSLKDIIGTLVQLNIVDSKMQNSTREMSKLDSVMPHPDGAGTKAKGKGFSVPSKADEPDDDDEDGDDEENSRSLKRSKAKRKARDEEDDDDEDEDEEDTDEEDADEDEDEDQDEEDENDDEEDADDEDEDEEEEQPRRRGKAKAKAEKDWPEPPPPARRGGKKGSRRSRL